MSTLDLHGRPVTLSAMRSVLLKGAPPDDQMRSVDRGAESLPIEWPANWRYLLLISDILDMIESHEIQIEQWAQKAVKGRALFDAGASYFPARETEADGN